MCLSPFFNILEMFACRQSVGSDPLSSEAWNIVVSAGASVSAQFFSMMLGMASGPLALFGLMFFSSFATPSTAMVMC